MRRKQAGWVVALMLVFAAGTGASASPELRPGNEPTSFVAVNAGGIAVYSSITGKRLRWLTHGDRDSYPVVTSTGWVYFTRPAPTFSETCKMAIWRVRTDGEALSQLIASEPYGSPFTVSPNGTTLAWGVGPGNCRAGDTAIMIDDLRTGRIHRIEGQVRGLAVSDNDTLAVVTGAWKTDVGQIRLVWDPFSALTTASGTVVTCPVHGMCDDSSPSFSLSGRLSYITATSPRSATYCLIHACLRWTYSLVEETGNRERILTAQHWHYDQVQSASIDPQGTAVIYTIPKSLWRWSRGHKVRIPTPNGLPASPTW